MSDFAIGVILLMAGAVVAVAIALAIMSGKATIVHYWTLNSTKEDDSTSYWLAILFNCIVFLVCIYIGVALISK